MKIRHCAVLIAIAWSACSFPAVAAPPSATAAAVPQEKPTEAEALALVRAYSPSHLRRKAELNILERDFVPGLRQAPEMAEILDAYPALGDELVKAVSAQIDIYIAEFDERFFPRGAEIVRSSLSRADTLTVTKFFNSPLAQKMQRLGAENIDGKEVMQAAVSGEQIDTGISTRQALRAGVAVAAKLTPSENQEVARFAMSSAGRNFASIRPKLTALQTELVNSPGPRFKEATEKAMKEVFQRVTDVNAGQQ